MLLEGDFGRRVHCEIHELEDVKDGQVFLSLLSLQLQSLKLQNEIFRSSSFFKGGCSLILQAVRNAKTFFSSASVAVLVSAGHHLLSVG